MIIRYFHNLLISNRTFLLEQGLALKGFMQLLMKQRNTGEKWSKEERKQLKQQLKIISLTIPALVVFLLPGGGILLPILAEVLDRRKEKR
jgi:hypothetical protein